jgi:hypothetical protein
MTTPESRRHKDDFPPTNPSRVAVVRLGILIQVSSRTFILLAGWLKRVGLKHRRDPTCCFRSTAPVIGHLFVMLIADPVNNDPQLVLMPRRALNQWQWS